MGKRKANVQRACELPGCSSRHYAKGMCRFHYYKDWSANRRQVSGSAGIKASKLDAKVAAIRAAAAEMTLEAAEKVASEAPEKVASEASEKVASEAAEIESASNEPVSIEPSSIEVSERSIDSSARGTKES